MNLKIASLALTAMLVMACPAVAQGADDKPDHAVGTDLLFSTDADQTDIVRLGVNFDWHHQGPEEYQCLTRN